MTSRLFIIASLLVLLAGCKSEETKMREAIGHTLDARAKAFEKGDLQAYVRVIAPTYKDEQEMPNPNTAPGAPARVTETTDYKEIIERLTEQTRPRDNIEYVLLDRTIYLDKNESGDADKAKVIQKYLIRLDLGDGKEKEIPGKEYFELIRIANTWYISAGI